MTPERLRVDDLQLEVRRSARRRSLELIVDRAGELLVAAPAGTSAANIVQFVRSNREWLEPKLARKVALRATLPRREYVTGEGFLYLGRSYRLRLVDEQRVPLSLRGGRFCLLRTERPRGRAHFVRWYTEHGRQWLSARVEALAGRVKRRPASVRVRDLGSRWASCARSRDLNFHWAAMTLPLSLLDYIALHELVHLEIADHSRRFWARLEGLLPNHHELREALAARGGAGLL